LKPKTHRPVPHALPRRERTTRETLEGPGRREVAYREQRIPIESGTDYAQLAELASELIGEWHAERRDAARASAGFIYQTGKLEEDGETVKWDRGLYVAGTSIYGIRTGKPGWDKPNPRAVGDARTDLVGRLEALAAQGFMGDEDGSRAIVRIRALFLRLESKKGGFAEDKRKRKAPSHNRKLRQAAKAKAERKAARSDAARKGWKARKARELAEHEWRSEAARKGWKTRGKRGRKHGGRAGRKGKRDRG
jgi:hypothetical protein